MTLYVRAKKFIMNYKGIVQGIGEGIAVQQDICTTG
jgi:hypothetical protein